MSDEGTIGAIVILIILLFIYFLPGIVAQHRKHPQQTAITVLNLLLGWTLLGWVIALVWACTSPTRPAADPPPAAARLPCPFCAELILPAAKACRFCGRDLPQDW